MNLQLKVGDYKKIAPTVKRPDSTFYEWCAGDAVDDSQGNLHHGGVDEPSTASFFLFLGPVL